MLAVKLFHDWLLAVVVSDFFLSNYNELKKFILHFDLHKKQNIPIVISVFFITIKIICQKIWVFWYKYTVNRSERLAILQSIFIPIVICWNYKSFSKSRRLKHIKDHKIIVFPVSKDSTLGSVNLGLIWQRKRISTYEWRQKKRKIRSKNTPEKQNNVNNHLQWGQGVKSIEPVLQNVKRYIELFIFEGISHLHNIYGEILV